VALTVLDPRTGEAQVAPPSMSLDVDLFDEIERMKKSMNAVILGHYYQDPDIQDVADFIGDSLQLAQEAAKTTADVIVFCGVHFMAETAKILNPGKQVLVPDLKAGCSLADGCPPEAFARFKAKYPDHFVVSYVNCSAGVKALSDVIVTSSNAKKIVDRIPKDRPILFAPDQHLGRYLIKETGRDMVLWPGSCQVHEIFSEKKILQLKSRHPDALVVAHPECEAPVLAQADHIGSTRSILDWVVASPAKSFIIATEPGIIHQMEAKTAGSGKVFIPAPPSSACACNECPHMKLNTLEKLFLCMKLRKPELVMDPELRARALAPIQRMLDWS
jgi:quinolinate synthase